MKEELEQAYAAIKKGEEEQARVLLARMLKDDPEYIPGWVLLSKLAPNNMQKAAFLDKILSLDPGHIYARQEMEALEAGVSSTVAAQPAGESVAEVGEEAAIEAAQVDAPVSTGDATVSVQPPRMREEEPGLPAGATVPEVAAAEPVLGPEVEAEEAEAGYGEKEAGEPEEDETVEPRMPISEDPFDYEAQAAGDTLPPWLVEDEALLVEELDTGEAADVERMPPEPELPDWLKEEPSAGWQAEEPAGGPVRLKEEDSVEAGAPSAIARQPRMETAPGTAPPPWLLISLSIALIIVFLLLIYFGIRLLG
jgi:hypothetical protein